MGLAGGGVYFYFQLIMSTGFDCFAPSPLPYNRVVRHPVDGDGNCQPYSLLAALSIRGEQRAQRRYSEDQVLQLKLPVFFHVLRVMFQEPMSFVIGLHDLVQSGDLSEGIYDHPTPPGVSDTFQKFGLVNDAGVERVNTYRGWYERVRANFLAPRTWCHLSLLNVYAVVLRVNIIVWSADFESGGFKVHQDEPGCEPSIFLMSQNSPLQPTSLVHLFHYPSSLQRRSGGGWLPCADSPDHFEVLRIPPNDLQFSLNRYSRFRWTLISWDMLKVPLSIKRVQRVQTIAVDSDASVPSSVTLDSGLVSDTSISSRSSSVKEVSTPCIDAVDEETKVNNESAKSLCKEVSQRSGKRKRHKHLPVMKTSGGVPAKDKDLSSDVLEFSPEEAMLKLAKCSDVCHCSGVKSSCLFMAFRDTQTDDGKQKFLWDALVQFISRLHNVTRFKTSVELRVFIRELYDQVLVSKCVEPPPSRQEFNFCIYSSEMKADVKLCRQMFEFCYGLGAGTFSRIAKQAKSAHDGKPTLYPTYAWGDDTFPGTDMIEAQDVYSRNGIIPGRYR